MPNRNRLRYFCRSFAGALATPGVRCQVPISPKDKRIWPQHKLTCDVGNIAERGEGRGSVDVKRDMDLVRKLLIAIEDLPLTPRSGFRVEGYPTEIVHEHLYLLQQAGLIEATAESRLSDAGKYVTPIRLTWEGHEYVGAFREDNRWNETKRILAEIGGVTLEVAKQIAVALMKEQAGRYLP